MKNKRVSIEDVAKRAGASITSVSRIINNVDYPVSEDIRSRVLKAIEDLHYSPNLAAQRLRSNFNNVVGIIVRDIENSHFAEIAKGATESAMKHEYLCFICNTGRSAESELKFHDLLWKNRVQGIILTGGGLDTPQYREMMQLQIERYKRFGLRLVACAPQGFDLPQVGIDFTEVGSLIASHLADAGHRRIALITGRADVLTSRAHADGYREALKAKGLVYDPALTAYGDFTEQAGYELCKGLLDRGADMSALCCGSDLMALGAIHALTERGLSVPRDVSLASIGDMPIAAYTQPPLTSVRIPRYEIGAKALEMILDPEESPRQHLFPVKLVERLSVRRL